MELRCSLVLRCIEFVILTAVFLLVNGPTWICPVTFGCFSVNQINMRYPETIGSRIQVQQTCGKINMISSNEYCSNGKCWVCFEMMRCLFVFLGTIFLNREWRSFLGQISCALRYYTQKEQVSVIPADFREATGSSWKLQIVSQLNLINSSIYILGGGFNFF